MSPAEQPGQASGSAGAAVHGAAPPAPLAAPDPTTSARSPSPVITREAPEEIELSASPSPQPQALGASALTALPADVLEAHLPGARARVLQLLAGSLPPPRTQGAECVGLGKQWTDLRGALFSTVAMGEGNSALVIGTRGTGKSLVSG
jgi:outer membrane receptor protein involved in Fe transport